LSIAFYKYHGTGNDFVMIDDRDLVFPEGNTELIKKLCTRRFGVGADGCILLQNHPTADFKMVYFNADGNESSMCGNGGRCLVAFASYLGLISDSCSFEAIDGIHEATIQDNWVSLKMNDVQDVSVYEQGHFLDTGSPHIVLPVEDLGTYNVFDEGRRLRRAFSEAGSNVNFVEWIDETLSVRTYERGVEDETFSCGTGVTAAAIAATEKRIGTTYEVPIKTLGGELSITFTWSDNGAQDIWLTGPAQQVFSGTF